MWCGLCSSSKSASSATLELGVWTFSSVQSNVTPVNGYVILKLSDMFSFTTLLKGHRGKLPSIEDKELVNHGQITTFRTVFFSLFLNLPPVSASELSSL